MGHFFKCLFKISPLECSTMAKVPLAESHFRHQLAPNIILNQCPGLSVIWELLPLNPENVSALRKAVVAAAPLAAADPPLTACSALTAFSFLPADPYLPAVTISHVVDDVFLSVLQR